jgi:hypothetical protein
MNKLFILSIFATLIWSCSHDSEINGVAINLIKNDDPDLFARSVILYDQADYFIKTPLDTFLSGYPCNKNGYGDMRTKAISDGQTMNVLNASDYFKLNSDSIHSLIYYLENGSCLVKEKTSNKIISTILVETYSEGEPMSSTCGRKFYINNKLFLKTVDLISK